MQRTAQSPCRPALEQVLCTHMLLSQLPAGRLLQVLLLPAQPCGVLAQQHFAAVVHALGLLTDCLAAVVLMCGTGRQRVGEGWRERVSCIRQHAARGLQVRHAVHRLCFNTFCRLMGALQSRLCRHGHANTCPACQWSVASSALLSCIPGGSGSSACMGTYALQMFLPSACAGTPPGVVYALC